MQLFLENFFASGLSILETEIIERQQLEEELRKAQEELKQKEMLLEQTRQKLQRVKDPLIQQAEMYRFNRLDSFGQMVNGVAHEINNPTSFIGGNLRYVREYIEDLLHIINLYAKNYPQPVDEIQSAIEEAELDFLIEDLPKLLSAMQIGVDRIHEVIKSLWKFSWLHGAEMSTVNLQSVIDNALLMVNDRLITGSHNPGIQVIKEYGELPMVECYAELLNQVFIYLLDNVIDALDERVISEIYQGSTNSLENATHYSPTINIRTSVSVDSSHVIIQIANNGSGMTQEILRRLFDPFFPIKPLGREGGLELTISHQIIEDKHGGQLECASTPERGTELTIELPIRQQPS